MSTDRVNEVDILRFIAALSVVFFHYAFRGYAADGMTIMPYPLLSHIAKYGYLGVQLFFMISGFVILMTASSGGGGPRKFVVSRLVRLYPAFWVCCTITFIVTILIGSPQYFVSLGQYLINMSMLSGFFNVAAVDGAYWSLFIELQFYLLVSVVLILKRIHQAQYFLITWLCLSIFLEVIPIGRLRYIFITEYAAFFIAGALFYLIFKNGFSLVRIIAILFALVLAIHVSFKALPHFEMHYSTSMNKYIIGVIIFSFFVAMLLISIGLTGFFRRRRWLMTGALTYPLYLLHQNIGFMIFNVGYPLIDRNILLWGVLIIVIGTSYIIAIYIEKPFSIWFKNNINSFFDFLFRMMHKLNLIK